nr:MAG TPA: hypothetical protein [Caudoviricetes sp.]
MFLWHIAIKCIFNNWLFLFYILHFSFSIFIIGSVRTSFIYYLFCRYKLNLVFTKLLIKLYT